MEIPQDYTQWIELVVLIIETLAVAIIALFTLYGVGRYVISVIRHRSLAHGYTEFRTGIARSMLLGLELLVAADIISTITLDPGLASLASLGLLVLIRTFLSWTLDVEITGEWPWSKKSNQKKSTKADGPGE